VKDHAPRGCQRGKGGMDHGKRYSRPSQLFVQALGPHVALEGALEQPQDDKTPQIAQRHDPRDVGKDVE
jgi:hypothetical protein